MDYAVPAFYHALPQYLKNDLIRLDKRAISIINPHVDYLAGGEVLDMKLIEEHEFLCKNLFNKIVKNANQKLADLLPKNHNSYYALRNEHKFNLPQFKRFKVCIGCSFSNIYILLFTLRKPYCEMQVV